VTFSNDFSRWAHWPRQTEAPYFGQFYSAMAPYGVVPITTLKPETAWVAAAEADVIHVHWPDGLWRQRGKNVIARFVGVRRLRDFFRSARSAGLKVVWTVHNERPHEGGDWVDALGYAAIARAAHLIVCHSHCSAEAVKRRYRPRATVLVMPYGNFAGVFPRPRERELVLTAAGFHPARPLVSCLGYLRQYKGLDIALAAVARLGSDVQLLIAGPKHPRFEIAALRRAVDALPAARLLDRRLSDQEFADFTAASDAALLPYLKVTTSSFASAAWSLGTGVIAADLPFFRELIPAPSPAARLFRTANADDLAKTIRDYLSIPLETRRVAAFERANAWPWSRSVIPVAAWLAEQRHV
jgi:glycosyltransferase involved in cell wall biosynthesis